MLVCNHGKHRSLSLGYELSENVGCELVSPRDRMRRSQLRLPHQFISYLAPRLEAHRERFGSCCHPISCIMVATTDFAANDWLECFRERGEESGCEAGELHEIRAGDLVVRNGVLPAESYGWWYGSVVRDAQIVPNRWFPPSFVKPLDRYHFTDVRDLSGDILRVWYSRGS